MAGFNKVDTIRQTNYSPVSILLELGSFDFHVGASHSPYAQKDGVNRNHIFVDKGSCKNTHAFIQEGRG